MMVAVNDGTGLQYLLTDHLGSTVAVTNQSGTLTSQQRYPSTSSGRRLPFGAARTIPNSPILGTDFTYTGQRKFAPADGMGGIMDYKARFYSPALMRFQQPDSIIPNQFNPQSWNRLSYVGNNPIGYNDPTGHTRAECNEDPSSCEHDDPAPDDSGGVDDESRGGRCNEDDDLCWMNQSDDDFGNEPDSCWVQLTTENYWANTCEDPSPINITLDNPSDIAFYFLYHFDSPRTFWTQMFVAGLASFMSPAGSVYRLAWKIAAKTLIGLGATWAVDIVDFYFQPKDYDDEMAALIYEAGNNNSTSVTLTIYQNTYHFVGSPRRGAPDGYVLAADSAVLVQASNSQNVAPMYMPSFYYTELRDQFQGLLSMTLP